MPLPQTSVPNVDEPNSTPQTIEVDNISEADLDNPTIKFISFSGAGDPSNAEFYLDTVRWARWIDKVTTKQIGWPTSVNIEHIHIHENYSTGKAMLTLFCSTPPSDLEETTGRLYAILGPKLISRIRISTNTRDCNNPLEPHIFTMTIFRYITKSVLLIP